jgi:pyridoxamine 5'-phosphate oxidase
MQRDLHDLRKTYSKDSLNENTLNQEPLSLFNSWFTDAKQHKLVEEANAMSLSTVGSDGFPKNRIVLLKEIYDDSFVFYTNYASEKGQAILAHEQVCLHFFWPALERQVIIKAIATKVPAAQSQAYFNKRPRGSQLGAWASAQSTVVNSRTHLEEELKRYDELFKDKDIPLPDFWGGFTCKPLSYEFWQGRPNRLHDRIFYEQERDSWNIKRLAP